MQDSSGLEPASDVLDELAAVPFDASLDALGHIQRRRVLFGLLDHDPQPDSLAVLADSADDIDGLDQGIALYHNHLPKLSEYGFIDWDRDANEVTTGPNFDTIKPLLELLAAHEDELPSGWI